MKVNNNTAAQAREYADKFQVALLNFAIIQQELPDLQPRSDWKIRPVVRTSRMNLLRPTS